MTDGVVLAKLDGEAPKPIAEAPVVYVGPIGVTFEGKRLAEPPITDSQAIEAALAANKASDLVFVIDATVPWSAVTIATAAAAHAGHAHVTFVFAAGAPGKTPPPPPSAVDHILDELAKPVDPSKRAPKLYASDDPERPPSVPDLIFMDCPIGDAFTQIGSAETSADKTKAIVEGIPRAIAACNCKVEIASVQRLLWAWYRRDSDVGMLGVGVDLADTGTAVTAQPTTPWSEAGKTLASAAKAGKPIALR
jgi:hypothetical protein